MPRNDGERGPAWATAGALTLLVTILCITLYPVPEAAEAAAATPLLCLVCGPRGGSDIFLNVLMLVPLGLCLRLAGWSWTRATISCGLLSLGIETLQYFWIPGRDASLSDVLSNTTGAAIGAAFAPHLGTVLAPGQRGARRLLLIGLGTWLGVALLSSWAILPWNDGGRALSERPERTTLHDAFTGVLRRVLVSGHSVDAGPLDRHSSHRVHELLASERIDIEVEVVSQRPVNYGTWIYRLRTGAGVLMIGQHGRDLTLEVPRRSAMLGVAGPRLRLADGAPATAGVPFTVTAGERGSHLWIESTVNDRVRRADLQLAPTMAWALPVPFDYAMGPEARFLTWIWLAALMLPLGCWAAYSGRVAVPAVVLALAIGAGLGLVPWLLETGPVPVRDWAAAVAGAVAGWAAGALAAYLVTRCGSPSASESSSS
ncbi:MAG: VanZ family protein [Gemmatimonadales bacterium]